MNVELRNVEQSRLSKAELDVRTGISGGSNKKLEELGKSLMVELLRLSFARGGGGGNGSDVNVVSSMRSSLDFWWANFRRDFRVFRVFRDEEFLARRTEETVLAERGRPAVLT